MIQKTLEMSFDPLNIISIRADMIIWLDFLDQLQEFEYFIFNFDKPDSDFLILGLESKHRRMIQHHLSSHMIHKISFETELA
jgi:hypothetical protein